MCGATYGFQQQPACRLCNLTARIVVLLYSEASVRLYVRMKTLRHGSKSPMGVIHQQYKARLPAAVPMPYISVQALKFLKMFNSCFFNTCRQGAVAGRSRGAAAADRRLALPWQPEDCGAAAGCGVRILSCCRLICHTSWSL